VRCFFALIPPPEVVLALTALQEDLRREPVASGLRWTPGENLHLTLRFLGEVDQGVLARGLAQMEEVSLPPPFELRLGYLGGFRSLGQARVLWVGLDGEVEHLRAARAAIDAAFPSEEEFSAHVTLARAKRRPIDLRQLSERRPRPVRWPVREVVLMHSRRGPTGSVYSIIWRRSLSS